MNNPDGICQKSNDPAIDITFRKVTYTVDVIDNNDNTAVRCCDNKPKKQLLSNVSGIFKAGEVTAIIGTSGSGKSTLLNVLAGRMSMKNQEGEIRANDVEYSYEQFGNFANYVMQGDFFMQTLTVRETLRFAADLKLKASHEEKEEMIEELAKSLKLEGCLDTLVGGELVKGISGGEKKRTSIAFELISDPQVLVLDEPTSGLDSFTSFVIIRHLKHLARTRNKTIAMTIRHPNSEIFALFDKLLLMIEGRIIFQGPADEAVSYFAAQFELVCKEFQNPADFLMSVMHHQITKNVERYPLYFAAYEATFVQVIEADIQDRNRDNFEKQRMKVSWIKTYCTLVHRDIKNILRNPIMIKSRLFQTILLSIYVGGLYCQFDEDYTETQNWQAVSGFFFFLTVNSVLISFAPVSLIFPQERTVFLKEESAKLYGVSDYFLSRNTVEIPYALIFPAIQSLILYWFVGLSSTPGQFFTFYLIILLINFNGMSLGLLAGSVVRDAKSVSTTTLLLLLPFQLFSGFFKNQANLPGWIGWIQYLSPFKYGFEAFTENETLYRQSNISQLNFNVGLWESIGCLAGLGIGFRILSLFFLWKLRTRIQ